MKSNYKILNIVLILVMLSHVSFFHEYLKNYVICYEPNGDVQVENINDCEECTNINLIIPSAVPTESSVNKTDCLDFPLDGDFFSHHQFITKNSNVLITNNILSSVPTFIKINSNIDFRNYKNTLIKNLILENFTSVLLII